MFPRLLALALVISLTSAKADTISVAPIADTCLFEFLPDHNWGLDSELVAGVLNSPAGNDNRCRILMKFDIAQQVPAGSIITGANLTMSALKAPSSPQNATFQLMRLFVPWEEGTKNGSGLPGGAAATTGETTWNHRFHTGTPWGEPGGKLEFDFAEDASASVLVSGQPNPGPDTYVLNFNSDGIADLNSMLNFPNGDHGWAFLAQNESTLKSARRWASLEHPTHAPVLEITFTPPPVLEITSAVLDSATGNLTIVFNSIPGFSYTIEYGTDLDTMNWTDEADDSVPSQGTSTTFTFTVPNGEKRLFFSVTPN